MNRKERRAAGERGPRQHPLVELAFIHPGDVSAAFMASVIRCRDYELLRTQILMQTRERRARSGSIAKARNQVTTMFLRSKNEWLFFVDADMGFPANALELMLGVADKNERPIIGGLCFAHRTEGFDDETNAEYFGHIPTISMFVQEEERTAELPSESVVGFVHVTGYPRDTLIKADTTGAAFLLIHRSVLERMQERYGDHWWSQIPNRARDDLFGEDTSFFLRSADLGIPLHIHTGVRTSHDKGGIFLTEHTFAEQELLRSMLEQIEQGEVTVDEPSAGESGSASFGSEPVAVG